MKGTQDNRNGQKHYDTYSNGQKQKKGQKLTEISRHSQNIYRDRQNQTKNDRSGLKRKDTHVNRQKWKKTDKTDINEQNQTETKRNEKKLTELDKNKQKWTEMDKN